MIDVEFGVQELEREADDRAIEHRRRAVEAAQDLDPAVVAVVDALLAVEARLEELTCFIAAR